MDNYKYVKVIGPATDGRGSIIKPFAVGIILHDKVKPVNHLMIDLHSIGRTIIDKDCLGLITKKEYFKSVLSQ